jgi:hypothetical protein
MYPSLYIYSCSKWKLIYVEGSHRHLSEKYRAILDSILTLGEDELVEGLKVLFIFIFERDESETVFCSTYGTGTCTISDSFSFC